MQRFVRGKKKSSLLFELGKVRSNCGLAGLTGWMGETSLHIFLPNSLTGSRSDQPVQTNFRDIGRGETHLPKARCAVCSSGSVLCLAEGFDKLAIKISKFLQIRT